MCSLNCSLILPLLIACRYSPQPKHTVSLAARARSFRPADPFHQFRISDPSDPCVAVGPKLQILQSPMGKKGALASIFSRLLVVDSPSSPGSEAPSPPWPWLSSPCRNPQTSSSRDHRRACSSAVTRSPAGRIRGGGGAGDDDMYKTANSAYQLDDDFPCFSPDDGGSCFDADEDEDRGELVEDDDGFSTTSASEEWHYASEAVIRGLGRTGGGRFFVDRPDPVASNSILAGCPSASAPEKKEDARPSALVEESVAVAVDSADPYGDFRASMEEMVSAHGLRGWADLQELLTWYLRVNGKRNHALIVAAFLDLLVALASSSPSAAADAPTTTRMMTTTSSSASGSASSGSTSASSSTCGCAGDGGTGATEQCCGGRGNDTERPCASSSDSEEAVGDEAGSTSAAASSSTGAKRRRTSKVWAYFDYKEVVLADGTTGMRACCKWEGCTSQLSGGGSGGTGHLDRHIIAHRRKAGQAASKQSHLSYNPDGTVSNWNYNPDAAREGLCRMIASLDMPLGLGESPAFTEYIREYQNPAYTPVSRQTTSRDMKKLCKKMIQTIKDDFTTCTFSVSLTSDIWTGRAKQDYISVVAHYVNNDNWELQKRIIGFELIDVSHTGYNIADKILQVVREFNLTAKIFAITLDNASSNTAAMEHLTPVLSTYAESFLVHQRCACHIINLIAKCALKHMNVYIDKIRCAIAFLNASSTRIANYKRFCDAADRVSHSYNQDMPVRWNSTFLMLQTLIPDKEMFTLFINANANGNIVLNENDWYAAEVMLKFLETLYDATNVLSGVYYPTSLLMVHQIVELASHLKEHECDDLLRNAIVKMKDKYLKYWKNIPILYAFAFILDPRAKTEGLGSALSVLTWAVGVDYSAYFGDVKDKLADLYKKYEIKYAAVRHQRPAPAAPSGKKKTAWGRIYPVPPVLPQARHQHRPYHAQMAAS